AAGDAAGAAAHLAGASEDGAVRDARHRGGGAAGRPGAGPVGAAGADPGGDSDPAGAPAHAHCRGTSRHRGDHVAHLEDTRARRAGELTPVVVGATPRLPGLRREVWQPALVVAVVLGAWETLVRAGEVEALFFPAPTTIVLTLARLAASGQLESDLAATLARLAAGFLLGGGAGLVLGLGMGWSYRLRVVVDPLVAAAHPIPKIAV